MDKDYVLYQMPSDKDMDRMVMFYILGMDAKEIERISGLATYHQADAWKFSTNAEADGKVLRHILTEWSYNDRERLVLYCEEMWKKRQVAMRMHGEVLFLFYVGGDYSRAALALVMSRQP